MAASIRPYPYNIIIGNEFESVRQPFQIASVYSPVIVTCRVSIVMVRDKHGIFSPSDMPAATRMGNFAHMIMSRLCSDMLPNLSDNES